MPSPHRPTDLSVFHDPASVAIVGASDTRSKWGYWLATGALEGNHRRRVDLINQRARQICGVPTTPTLRDLTEVPELVALCVPPAQVPDVVTEALELGVRGFLGITSGVTDEPELATRIRAAGARLIGTNSLGMVDTATDLQLAWGRFKAGPLAIVSQSGQVGSELAILGARKGLGVSRFVSAGNASDVTPTELLLDLVRHEQTRVVAVYLESFAEGEALFAAMRTVRDSGRPVLLLTVGGTAASAGLARSHTGSLTTSLDIVDAACRAAGIARMHTPSELIATAQALLTTVPPAGRRVAIVGDSGGQCGIAADAAAELGLSIPEFSNAQREALAALLPAGAATSNPVDLAGAGERNLNSYATITEAALQNEDMDAALITGYFGRYTKDIPELAEPEAAIAQRIGRFARKIDKPVVVHSMAPEGPTASALWAAGVPVFGRVADALAAVRGMTVTKIEVPTVSVPPTAGVVAGYRAARERLAAYGIEFPTGLTARSRTGIEKATRQLAGPWVLKAAWIAHKTEMGGVRIGLTEVTDVLAAYDEMVERLGPGEYLIEEQDRRADTVEVLVGARRDPNLGPLIVVGAGGTAAEVHRDLAMEMAPVSGKTAVSMLRRLRCAPLFDGWRGRPAVDIEALAEVVRTVSQVIAASPEVAEVELNPVLAGPAGAVAVDALIVGAA